MSELSKVVDQNMANVIGNACFSKATLAINAGSAATIKTTGTTTFTVGGVFYTKAALSAQSFAATHRADGAAVSALDPQYVQPISSTVFYVVALNAAGTVAVVQGSYAGQQMTYGSDISKVTTMGGGLPALPSGYTAIGVVKIATNGSTTFTPGTTALDAAGVTATYYDVARLPASL